MNYLFKQYQLNNIQIQYYNYTFLGRLRPLHYILLYDQFLRVTALNNILRVLLKY